MPSDPENEREIRSAYGPGIHEANPLSKMVVAVKALVHYQVSRYLRSSVHGDSPGSLHDRDGSRSKKLCA